MTTTPSAPQGLTGVLLAAGAGTRLGRGPKALLDLGGRQWAAHLSAELLAGGCTEVVLVVGAGAEDLRASDLAEGVRVVMNPAWRSGLSTSFRRGVAAAPDGSDVLVALVDQPGLHRGVVRRLAQARSAGNAGGPGTPPDAIAATYPARDGSVRRGHPVLFSAASARQAADLAVGDAGARAWLALNADRVLSVDCGDLDTGDDVDLPADLESWHRRLDGRT